MFLRIGAGVGLKVCVAVGTGEGAALGNACGSVAVALKTIATVGVEAGTIDGSAAAVLVGPGMALAIAAPAGEELPDDGVWPGWMVAPVAVPLLMTISAGSGAGEAHAEARNMTRQAPARYPCNFDLTRYPLGWSMGLPLPVGSHAGGIHCRWPFLIHPMQQHPTIGAGDEQCPARRRP